MQEPIETVAIVALTNDSVLLIKHTEGADHLLHVYGLPAGRVDEGETFEQAGYREFEEETGMKAKTLLLSPKDYIAEIPRKDGTKKLFHMTVFLCTEWEGTLRESQEGVPQWRAYEELHSLSLLPNVDKAIADAKALLFAPK